MRILQVIDLGLMDYEQSHNLQLRLVEERIEEKISDTLLLLEHPHVITLGRKMKDADLKIEGIPVYRVERGGEATYHGPGQLVGYLIINLNSSNMSVKELVWNIEEVLIKTLKEFNIYANRVDGYPGVWVGGKKIASIGLALKWWITFHGFALNVNTDLNYFKLINPCGLDPDVMTSMEKILRSKVDMDAVKKIIVKNMVEVFQYTLRNSY
ncbi:MAG: lipoyl(octanoyl) transferase LipB [Aigarchaeota archaeon]|nr:lipoyl(octanoyl) transferase LipB [Aigarchaeota archaeon]MCX8193307.1 lipoyl(octanoyl) transferase LipB [Nitrososphaeria archaeon]MDW7986526.1 lipoyl(octanoyl) transferase LipB [Nitrososphaerota archaeon]